MRQHQARPGVNGGFWVIFNMTLDDRDGLNAVIQPGRRECPQWVESGHSAFTAKVGTGIVLYRPVLLIVERRE